MSTPLTFEEAYELLDQAETKDDIRAVINRISVGGGDAISVLFSGAHSLSKTSGKGMIGTVDLANALAANADGVRVMGNTDMGRFMITDKDAPDANFKLIRALNRVCNGDTDEIKRFMYGHYEDGVLKEPGLWDDASARFVHNIKGDVLTFTGNANIDRIFARTELPILLENTNVKSIDGIPRELLAALPKDNGIPKEAFEAIRTMSALRTARLGIPVSEEGLPIAERGRVTIESREFLAGLKGLTHKPVDPTLKFEKLGGHFDVEMARTHTQGLQVLRKLEIDLTPVLERPMDAKIASFLLGSLNRFGILFDAVDVFRLGYVGLEAKQAYDQGDREKGDSLLSKWALENGGALLGGRIGAALGLAILGGATGGLGLVVGLGLGLLGAHLGSTYGDEAFAIVAHGLADLHAWTLARLRQLFGDAEHHISPIILDLDGNGIDTLAMSDWRIHFDHDHNGFAERTGWVGPRDGLLVRDLDGNGLIDTGKELFGNYSQLGDGRSASHGFEALATLDEDRNGILNSNDSGWRSIAIWVDANSSATVEPGEIKSLSSLRIESLSLSFRREKIIDRQGNKHVEISSYTRDDASSYAMHDVWFAIDQNQSIDRQGEPTTPWLKRIPNLHGSSVVPNLRQAISDDASGRLITLLEKWVKAADQDRSRLLNEFIFAWTGVTATTTSSVATLEHFYQQKLYTLERLLGKSYRSDADYRNPSSIGLALLDQAFEDVKRSIAISLIAQNELIVLLRLTQELTDARTGKEGLDASKAARWIERCFDPLRDQQRLRDLGQAMKLLPDQGKALADGLRREWNSDISQIVLLALVLDDSSMRAGSVESDWISDTSGSDILSALNGHDQLHSTSGRDIHIGGKGNDVITSGAGDDLFVFSHGDGQDLISDMDDTPANLDTVQLLNLNPSDLSAVLRHDHDLQLIFHSGDRLSVAQYFVSTRHRIEQFHFADGSQWSHKELQDLIQVAGATAGHDALGGYNDICNRIDGLDGNDYLAGGLLNDVLRGSHGHDQLHGRAGDDLLEGGAGDDQLWGDSGRDSLHGGLGNDRLEGGEGDDLYHFSRGDGQDLISDMDDTPANLDVVQLLHFNPSDLSAVLRHDHDLQLSFHGGDRLTVAQYFVATRQRIEQFRFADGSQWSHKELLDLIQVAGATAGHDALGGYNDICNRIDGLDGNDYLAGGALNDVLRGNHGHDQLIGLAGDDLLEGGAGDDQLWGNTGRDSLYGGLGNDRLEGGEGDDLYHFSRGDGQDLISDMDDNLANRDTVQLFNLNPSDLSAVLRHDHDLQLVFHSGDRLSVAQYFVSTRHRIEQFRFADGSQWSQKELLDLGQIAGATAGHDALGGYNDICNRIDGLAGNDYLAGGLLNDVLRGNHGHDQLIGLAGDDLLEGGAGNDTLVGGLGRDLLMGGIGADVYAFARGDGQDRLRDVDTNRATLDQVVFNDQGTSQVTGVLRSAHDLQLTMASGDHLTVLEYFAALSNRIEQFRFADGHVWGHSQLLERLTIAGATAGNDTLGGYNDTPNRIDGLEGHDALTGGALSDVLRGNHGNDLLRSRGGDDLLEGGFGDDQLWGEAGRDTLIGGPGHDLLDGGLGADVYHFSRGDGQDRIRDTDASTTNIDQVQFQHLSTSQVSGVLRRSNDLQLNFNSGDQMTVLGYFSSTANRIEQFHFADARTWNHADLTARLTGLA